MTVLLDPQGAEITALQNLVDFTDRRVLEIGCGDGRLTWRYAGMAAHVTAIDPDPERIAAAKEACPRSLRHKVDFRLSRLQAFSYNKESPRFEIALLSWSL